ncbi:NADH-quinone oxidoreductase subunit NuoB [Spirillospora sp. CA-128828]|uniref:NADH-quinone oxidoreductase subunit B n=1 Tax=Spirillospora sp. CA-128828 TaxID=3240033 RepID=UPI003D8E621F
MGTIDLPPPSVGPLSRLAPKPIKFVLNWGRRYSLWVFNFGLACCAIEFIATSMSRHDFIRLGVIPFAPGPRQADLMVVSGTVSDKMAPAVRRLYEQMPEPKYVISFGACSNCGGPYWDSYCVTKGVDQIIPVDVYVPGCPPRPEALLHGIVHLQEKIAAESLGDRYGGGEPLSPPPPPRPLTGTVLRRPLKPPPPPDLHDTFEHWSTQAEEAAPGEGAADETMPVRHLGDAEVQAETPAAEPEPEVERAAPPARPGDTTQPVHVVPDDQATPPARPDDRTLPVPPVEGGEAAPPVRPDDRTLPVPPVEDEASSHDPSIIPGLADDEHDDQIGRDR